MESSPRPGYYPDPSVPGYIRYWDGSKWVPGTSKPMPKKAGGTGDAEQVVESGTMPPPPLAQAAQKTSTASAASAAPAAPAASTGSLPPFEAELPMPQQAAHRTAPFEAELPMPQKASAFAQPRPLSEVSFDDAKPSPSPFSAPRSLADISFDDEIPEPPRPAPPSIPGFQVAAGSQAKPQPPAPPQTPPVTSASGMGISITGMPGMTAPPKQTPAQMSAANQALRIRLLRADGKPFDGPEITTGPKQTDKVPTPSRTEFDKPRGSKIQKQAPKVVVKAGPLERAGHVLAVLLISAAGIVPLAFLMLQSVHDREDKLAATITVPTKMNVLDSTSEGYLGGMVAVLLVVTLLYWMRLKRRRER